MHNVEFTVEEMEVLHELVRHQLEEMEVEVGRTDTREFKTMLKHRREVLERALAKLDHAVPAMA